MEKKYYENYDERSFIFNVISFFTGETTEMKYILFGAGDIGQQAFKILGEDLVECFADNRKNGTTLFGKKVISFYDMIKLSRRFKIIITSRDYVNELEEQLKKENITDYLVFLRRKSNGLASVLPQYNYLYNTLHMHYTDIPELFIFPTNQVKTPNFSLV